ncbi:uncharacterized protein TNCV_3406841 [Trichonephila clavipes]|nr:uncharacterized protein TNCV_3406841 [Trichonephila clavipes]
MIIITDSELTGDFIWNGNPFAGQEHTLIWFSAVRCSLTGALTYDSLGSMNIKGLENLPRLEGIDLSQNHLVTVQKSAFSHIHRKLKTIVLSRNIIQEVLPGSFHSLKNLQHIDLSHNVLENITRDIFNSEPKFLRHINLRLLKELKRYVLPLQERLTRLECMKEDQCLTSHSLQLLEKVRSKWGCPDVPRNQDDWSKVLFTDESRYSWSFSSRWNILFPRPQFFRLGKNHDKSPHQAAYQGGSVTLRHLWTRYWNPELD